MNEFHDFKLNSGANKITPNASFEEIAEVLEKADKLTYKFDKHRAHLFLADRAGVDATLFNLMRADLTEACK